MRRARKAPAPKAEGAIAAIGLKITALIKADPDNEESWKNGRPKISAAAKRLLSGRREALQDQATHEVARTAADALVQTILSYSALMDLRDNFIGAEDSRESGKLVLAMERCLFSLLRYFEAEHRLNGEDFASEFFMGSYLDPFGVTPGHEVSAPTVAP